MQSNKTKQNNINERLYHVIKYLDFGFGVCFFKDRKKTSGSGRRASHKSVYFFFLNNGLSNVFNNMSIIIGLGVFVR